MTKMETQGCYKYRDSVTYLIDYCFVWRVKRGKPILQGDVSVKVQEIFTDTVKTRGWELHDLAIHPNFVFISLGAKPGDSPNTIVWNLKRFSSTVVKREFEHLATMPAIWTKEFLVVTGKQMIDSEVYAYGANKPIANKTNT